MEGPRSLVASEIKQNKKHFSVKQAAIFVHILFTAHFTIRQGAAPALDLLEGNFAAKQRMQRIKPSIDAAMKKDSQGMKKALSCAVRDPWEIM